MKLLILLVLAVVATAMLSCTGDIPAPPDPIRDFAVADSENIWIVTRDSDVFHRSGSEVEKIKLKARQVFFLNSFEGWLLGKDGQTWSTTDGGAKWLPRGTIGYDQMSDYGGQLVFASNLDGWIVGATGIVWLTENGGDTWSRVYPNDELNSELRGRGSMGYVPIDADNGWMGMDGGYILRTRNKGKTWEVTSVGDDCSILSLFPFPNDDAIAFCFERSRILGGNSVEGTWMDGPRNRETANVGIFSASFSSKHVGWAVGIEFNSDTRQKAKGVVLRTVDGAETWQRQQVEVFGEQWKKVRFLNENDGWLVSQSTVFRTTDSGGNWKVEFEADPVVRKPWRFRK